MPPTTPLPYVPPTTPPHTLTPHPYPATPTTLITPLQYGLTMLVTSDDGLSKYLTNVLDQLKEWLTTGTHNNNPPIAPIAPITPPPP